MEIEIAVRKHHLPHVFSEACLQEAAKIPMNAPNKYEKPGRFTRFALDHRWRNHRDFDDAVYAEKISHDFHLIVAAIANLAEPLCTPRRCHRHRRAGAHHHLYFPRRVIPPMLPEKLSNGICSLNPDVDRLCMVSRHGGHFCRQYQRV